MSQNQAVPATHNQPEYSVTEISYALKRTVEERFSHVRVRGEVSGYRGAHSSGHCYFALKDDKSKIDAVIWKGVFGKLRFKPEEGMEVIATGSLTTYPGKSNYQIVIESIEPAGVGALMALLEKRKAQLAAEGLFAPERKKPLPFMPTRIGIVTSPTGAVIRDILHRISDRFGCHVLVWPVRVQGEGAAEEIAAAIHGFNALAGDLRPDVLIVARGGGSLEDLWCFNEECVVRAATASTIPLISAVGHETDTTLIDFASDRRAPTPTAAAEMAVPVREEWLLSIQDYGSRMNRSIVRQIVQWQQQVEMAARAIPKPSQILALQSQQLDGWSERLDQALPGLLMQKRSRLEAAISRHQPHALRQRISHALERLESLNNIMQQALQRRIERHTQRLELASQLFASLNVQSVLARGFALLRSPEGAAITSHAALQQYTSFRVVMMDGEAQASLGAKPRKKTTESEKQESLF